MTRRDIWITINCLQTIKDQDSQLHVHQSFALPYLDSKSKANVTIQQQSPAIKFSNDLRYRPVNSDWRKIKSKEVLDNETDFPLLIDIKYRFEEMCCKQGVIQVLMRTILTLIP